MNTLNALSGSASTSSTTSPVEMGGPVVGVRTTRIYCRPECRPGRAPKPENCVPFPDAAAARAAGYRACKQCRPDDAVPPKRLVRAEELEVRFGVGPVPIGLALVAMTPRGIRAIHLLDDEDPAAALERSRRQMPGARFVADPKMGAEIASRVTAYLTEGRACDDLAFDLVGTPFQISVWQALRAIPWGETTTYGGLALSLGLPKGAARAVGTACGTNPVSLLIPCHRVVGAGGGLGGYYWGLERKQVLLDLERRGRDSCTDGNRLE
jgi:O-6-methylguanine DNA methyltransferase